jgi:hypothetical protein
MVSRLRPDAPERQIVRLLTRHDRTENAAPLKSTSVTNGRTRFIGNESLIVIGSQKVEGWLVVTGTERVTGLLEILGTLSVQGDMTLDGGTITAGNVVIEDNVIRVGDDIEIDAATNRIRVADMVIDPTGGGQVEFPGGAMVRGGSTGGVALEHGDYKAVVTNAGVSVGRDGRSVSVTEAGIQILGAPEGSPGTDYPAGVYYRNSLGFVSIASGS